MGRLTGLGMPLRVFVKEHLNGHHRARRRRYVARHLWLTADLSLHRTPRADQSIWAVGTVRNEEDVLRLCVDHLWTQGFHRLLVVDHASTDGTGPLLAELAAADPRVAVAQFGLTGFYQSDLMTILARVAWRQGAAWVVPVDADEFWYADGQTVGDFLRGQTADIVHADRFNAIPLEDGLTAQTRMAFCPRPLLPKVAFRTHPLALVAPGNHRVARVGRLSSGYTSCTCPIADRGSSSGSSKKAPRRWRPPTSCQSSPGTGAPAASGAWTRPRRPGTACGPANQCRRSGGPARAWT